MKLSLFAPALVFLSFPVLAMGMCVCPPNEPCPTVCNDTPTPGGANGTASNSGGWVSSPPNLEPSVLPPFPMGPCEPIACAEGEACPMICKIAVGSADQSSGFTVGNPGTVTIYTPPTIPTGNVPPPPVPNGGCEPVACPEGQACPLLCQAGPSVSTPPINPTVTSSSAPTESGVAVSAAYANQKFRRARSKWRLPAQVAAEPKDCSVQCSDAYVQNRNVSAYFACSQSCLGHVQ